MTWCLALALLQDQFPANDVLQLLVPKLKRICFFFLIEMQVVNFVQPWSGVSHKKLANDILDRQSREPRAACPSDIVNNERLERQPFRFKVYSHKVIELFFALPKPLMGFSPPVVEKTKSPPLNRGRLSSKAEISGVNGTA